MGELGQEGQRLAAAIDGDGRRAGRIDADADDAIRAKAGIGSGRLHRATNAAIEALDIVGRVLPRRVRILGIEEDARLAAGIIVDVGGDFATIGDVDHQGTHAIGAVIDADGKCRFAFLGHDGPFLRQKVG